ncbi:MAG: PilZ domain-containing protein [Candidatus Methylomirabilales bacterium]
MSEIANRRRSHRISCNLSVEYKFRGGRLRGGQITNLGTNGLLLTISGTTPPVGAELLLRFYLPPKNCRVQVIGSVRWTTQGTAGVKFTILSHQAQAEIREYCKRESARAA